ncbi:MAG: hypothetical protein KDD47_27035, partial [Acidobacteria bacterium]|nr:hypothetical protein [Acidobacteriota bacterium]
MASNDEARKEKRREYIVRGTVTFGETGRPAVGYQVVAMDADLIFDDRLGEATTGSDGEYEIRYGVEKFRDLLERAPDVYLRVFDGDGKLVTDTRGSVVRNAGPDLEIHVQVPGSGQEPAGAVEVGGVPVDPRVFAALGPAELLDLAEAAVSGPGEASRDRRLASLHPDLDPKRLEKDLCFTPLTRFLRDAVRRKEWGREVSLRLEEILIGYRPDAAYATHNCPNFQITYQDSGSDQPPTADTGGNIT